MRGTPTDRHVLWCRHSGEPVRRAGGGDGPGGKVVHAGAVEEPCADSWNVAAPSDVDPELAETAKRVMRDYTEYEVVVAFGFLLRVAVRDALTAVPVEAKTAAGLRRGIDKQVRMRRLASDDAECREAAQR